jgi:hypothetical protein
MDSLHQLIKCSLSRQKAVDPVQVRQPNAQTSSRLNILDTKRDYHLLTLAGDCDFAADVLALVATLGKNEQHRATGVYCVGNLIIKWPTWTDITRSNPTMDATPLKFADDLQGGGAVFADMTNKQIYLRLGHGTIL